MSVRTYRLKKSGNLRLSEHFTVREFRCRDGSDTVLIDDRLVTLLENIRERFGKPVRINSAYRTAKYNARIGGVSNSYHVKGMAADIVVQDISPKRVAQYAETLNCGGIGWYEHKKFVHIDTRPKRVCWKDSGPNVRKTFSECPYAEPSHTLQFGDAGAAWIQWHLKKCGAKITIDGKFGAVTKAAVVAFQKAHGLTPDGVVGEMTRLMLKREVV
ncbi:MAG: DUF882 domain-containing protein [Clostridia bacterium]|nr:DUF882 domain-containing protein [Clostridia bacterium]MBQ1555385.1 DUF882 domain-containing protein [Clostridia bacterium]